MPQYRSRTSTAGRNMAGARALWRATGMKDGDFEKPIIAVVNSFTQFVPGHVHLKDLGQLVAREIEAAGGVAKEFNTIAIDDGIAMGHGGMLYSLPSRDLIADSVEYMCNGHTADAMVCISNCDKITPGMLMAALRLNIPAIFVSGGPMEAGKVKWEAKVISLDLVDAMVKAADSSCSDEEVNAIERSACPTCGSCSGMFTANSMNCLTEALGLSLPGNGTVVATHADRERLFKEAGRRIVDLARRYYEHDDESVLPRSIASYKAFENAISLDVAMGGSTNTVLHLLAAAQEGGVQFTMSDIDRLSRRVPNLCKVAPATQKYHIEDVHRAGGIMAILGELARGGSYTYRTGPDGRAYAVGGEVAGPGLLGATGGVGLAKRQCAAWVGCIHRERGGIEQDKVVACVEGGGLEGALEVVVNGAADDAVLRVAVLQQVAQEQQQQDQHQHDGFSQGLGDGAHGPVDQLAAVVEGHDGDARGQGGAQGIKGGSHLAHQLAGVGAAQAQHQALHGFASAVACHGTVAGQLAQAHGGQVAHAHRLAVPRRDGDGAHVVQAADAAFAAHQQ